MLKTFVLLICLSITLGEYFFVWHSFMWGISTLSWDHWGFAVLSMLKRHFNGPSLFWSWELLSSEESQLLFKGCCFFVPALLRVRCSLSLLHDVYLVCLELVCCFCQYRWLLLQNVEDCWHCDWNVHVKFFFYPSSLPLYNCLRVALRINRTWQDQNPSFYCVLKLESVQIWNRIFALTCA